MFRSAAVNDFLFNPAIIIKVNTIITTDVAIDNHIAFPPLYIPFIIIKYIASIVTINPNIAFIQVLLQKILISLLTHSSV